MKELRGRVALLVGFSGGGCRITDKIQGGRQVWGMRLMESKRMKKLQGRKMTVLLGCRGAG